MWNGKLKALTFSYDDGITQDKRLIEIFNKYGLKATFNLNSEKLGEPWELEVLGAKVSHNKVMPEEVKELYKGHEVAVHTLKHPNLTTIEDDAEVIRQVEEDRKNLERLTGGEVIGMAYPCGGVNNDDRVAKIIKENTGVQYSRTITSTGSFDLQDNLYRFNPTVFHVNFDEMVQLGKKFLELNPDKPQLYYIWGHSYELDAMDNWKEFEDFCKMMSGHDDIFYGTNREVLLNK